MLRTSICGHALSSETSLLPHGACPVDPSIPYCEPCIIHNTTSNFRAKHEILRANSANTAASFEQLRRSRKSLMKMQVQTLASQRQQEDARRRALEENGVVVISTPSRKRKVQFEDPMEGEPEQRPRGEWYRRSPTYKPGRHAAREGMEFWDTSHLLTLNDSSTGNVPIKLSSKDKLDAIERDYLAGLKVIG